jgi:hypothetical protein
LQHPEKEEKFKIRRESLQKKAKGVHREGPEKKHFRADAVCKRPPEVGGKGSAQAARSHDEPDPEKGLFGRVRAYFKNIEGNKDPHDIAGKRGSGLRKAYINQVPTNSHLTLFRPVLGPFRLWPRPLSEIHYPAILSLSTLWNVTNSLDRNKKEGKMTALALVQMLFKAG